MAANYCSIRGIAIIGSCPDGTKELNLIKFEDKPPKYDLRAWKEEADGKRTMCKGITLTIEEARRLQRALNEELGDSVQRAATH